MDNKQKQNQEQEELLKEYYAQVDGSEEDVHAHVDYSDSYGDSCC